MGVQVIKVPDVGEGIAEVEIVSWSVSVGDAVERNQILAEVMTDKANVEIPSPVHGVITVLNGEIGEVKAVGTSLIELSVEGGSSTPDEPVTQVVTQTAPPQPPPSDVTATSHGDPTPKATRRNAPLGGPPRAEGERPLASPAVRRRARDGGIDLRRVAGTGPAGRITHEDLDAYWEGEPAALAPERRRVAAASAPGRADPNTDVDEQPIIGIRRQIARRMLASTQSIPHITYVEEVDVTALEDLRATLNHQTDEQREAATSDGGRPRLTLLPFLILAIVDAIEGFPHVNAHVDDETDTLTTFGGAHVGIATQTPNGLVVPVVRHAETASLWELAVRINDLAEQAREGRAAPADLSGSTITISSLGALGGIVTTPLINKPEVAVIGVNKIVTRPVFVDGAVAARKMMNLSSSFDHRIVDGWDAASFIQHIRRSLEEPALLFIDKFVERDTP